MVKVAIYVRVSTEEQAKEGISIDAQLTRCNAFCISKGWTVHKNYVDAGYSAGSFNRPAMKELKDDIEENKFDVLLVYKIDRFSRNLKDMLLFLDEIKSKGINFSSVTEQIDTTTAMG
ncbi:recombinase family protein, partial [Candidatus Woesearchaeota archaeon]|nr:recombinase family protein [Candidatus Woesearchaeota archaeon]